MTYLESAALLRLDQVSVSLDGIAGSLFCGSVSSATSPVSWSDIAEASAVRRRSLSTFISKIVA